MTEAADDGRMSRISHRGDSPMRDSATLHDQVDEKSTYHAPASDNDPPPGKPRPPKASPEPVRLVKRIFGFILSQWLLVGMGIVILLAWAFPSVGKRGGHIRSEYTITYGAVAIIFLVSGLSLPFKSLRHHATNIRLHLIVQVMSFLVTSSVFFGISAAASTSSVLEIGTLVGLIATGCLPTTIASNVVMTREAKGDEAATMVEVTLGNLLGPFITPFLLTKLYLPSSALFRQWLPLEATNNLGELYRHVMMQIGLSVFVPLFVGQVIRAIWPATIQKIVTKYKLGKVGSVCLLGLVWATFCTAFASRALQTINTPTIIFNIFVNLALCLSFTLLSFFLARPSLFLHRLSPRIFRRIDREETISICFCAPAKTQALGIPLITAMYTSSDDITRALIQVPMILYTAEQIVIGQGLIWLFLRWKKREDDEKDRIQLADGGGRLEAGNQVV